METNRESFNDYVFLEPIRGDKTSSFDTDKAEADYVFQKGKVIYTNPENKCKVGDVVLYNKGQATDQNIDGRRLKIVREVHVAIKL